MASPSQVGGEHHLDRQRGGDGERAQVGAEDHGPGGGSERAQVGAEDSPGGGKRHGGSAPGPNVITAAEDHLDRQGGGGGGERFAEHHLAAGFGGELEVRGAARLEEFVQGGGELVPAASAPSACSWPPVLEDQAVSIGDSTAMRPERYAPMSHLDHRELTLSTLAPRSTLTLPCSPAPRGAQGMRPLR